MRRLFSLLPLVLTACALCLSPGCASLSRASKDVAVSLVDLRPSEASAFETRLLITVRYTNQSPRPLAFSGSRHSLKINGRAVGVAVDSEPIELPGLETRTKEITLNLSNIALLSLVRELQRNPAAVYEIDSDFFVPGSLSRTLHAHQTGTVNLSSPAASPAP